MIPILSITGSDTSGFSGLQQDFRIVTEMGGHPLTAATCMVIQNRLCVKEILDFPTQYVCKQIQNAWEDFHPKAVKVGLVRSGEAIKAVADCVAGCNRIVVAPGLFSTNGELLAEDEIISSLKVYLVPKATLLILRCMEAERILGCCISTDEDMLAAARKFMEMGARYVMLRGGKVQNGRITALLAGEDYHRYFSSYNIDGWQQHGVGGALSTAIAVRLGMGDDVRDAVLHAHEFVHSRVVYSVSNTKGMRRPADVYNQFMNLLSSHYQTAHDVAFYADKLNVSTRYLSGITSNVVGKSPKQIISDYLLHESKQLLGNSRLSVKEVSDRLGFSSAALFCKFFKQQQHLSPGEYRMSAESLS